MFNDWFDNGEGALFNVIGALFVVIFGALTILILGFVIAFGYHVTGIPCSNAGKLLGAETNFTLSNGCWVKVNDRFLPITEVVAIDKDGKTMIVPKAPIRMEINK